MNYSTTVHTGEAKSGFVDKKPSNQKMKTKKCKVRRKKEKCEVIRKSISGSALASMRIRIQLFTSLRIRIQGANGSMRIRIWSDFAVA